MRLLERLRLRLRATSASGSCTSAIVLFRRYHSQTDATQQTQLSLATAARACTADLGTRAAAIRARREPPLRFNAPNLAATLLACVVDATANGETTP